MGLYPHLHRSHQPSFLGNSDADELPDEHTSMTRMSCLGDPRSAARVHTEHLGTYG